MPEYTVILEYEVEALNEQEAEWLAAAGAGFQTNVEVWRHSPPLRGVPE